MSELATLHMGHGQMVDVNQLEPGRWSLAFYEDGVVGYEAPPLAEIEADGIDAEGCVTEMTIANGPDKATVIACSNVAEAHRIRLRVLHGDHFHTREAALMAADKAPVTGTRGGSLVSFEGGLAAEIVPVTAKEWSLFFSKDGQEVPPPEPETLTLQAISEKAENYQIRNLKTSLAPEGDRIVVAGKIKDAIYARISLDYAGAEMVRSVPVFLTD